ncbi:MAG: response regulator [Deltaproteobacteria bacterium]|nr:response regulator [Deltaproteobacteria bacterium]
MVKKILIVSTDRTIRLMAGFTLQMEEYKIVEAHNKDDAIKKIEDGFRPDLILNGLDLNGPDGLAFIKEVRDRPEFRYMPILTLANDSALKNQIEWQEVGVTGWVPQPFTGKQLLEMVNLVLF